MMSQEDQNAIAIIGIAGKFPGASDLSSFWENLSQGKESIARFSTEELEKGGVSRDKIDSPYYVRARGILENVDLFDAEYFGMPPLEAQLTDPQHRLFLECALEALEEAGLCPEHFSGTIGVYGGSTRSSYFLNNIYPNQNLMESMGNYQVRIGNEQDYLTTKASYKLNLTGPSLNIQTACSTGLTAICVACNHLLSYQCDAALAGAVSISVPQESGYPFQEGMIFAPDGHCRAFDAKAQGTVPSNGVGFVVLKRLEDALADRDHIHAIIKGYGMNNDGANKISFSAPSMTGQQEAIESALHMAEVDPESIQYVEAHGTATFLGDPIEMSALKAAFNMRETKAPYCAIGSVKTNIGHCMEAAGIAGLLKATLSLVHKKIPPSLHFSELNPHIEADQTPFYVNTKLTDWSGAERRRCGVSSFGVGGTNAHVILEEAPESAPRKESSGPFLIPLSAKNATAFRQLERDLSHFLKNHPNVLLKDVAFTLQLGRSAKEFRRALICRNRMEAISLLSGESNQEFSLQDSQDTALLEAASLWASGGAIDWKKLQDIIDPSRSAYKVALPKYPFQKKRHWIDPPTYIPSIDLAASKATPSGSLEVRLTEIWEECLGVSQIDVKNNFFSLGGDSLLALQMISDIQKKLGYEIKLQQLYEHPTISGLVKALTNESKEFSPLVLLRNGTDSTPLFFTHGIDGSLLNNRPIAEQLQFQGPIYGIQIQNGGQTLKEIASASIAEMQKVCPNGPYLLCGYSFGGILAYEMACQLEQSELPVQFLGIIDALNPKHPIIPRNQADESLSFLIELLSDKEITLSSNNELENKLIDLFGYRSLSIDQQSQIIERVKNSLRLLEGYTPGRYKGNIAFFDAEEKFFRMPGVPFSTTWKALVNRQSKAFEVPGNHHNLLQLPQVATLAESIDRQLLC